MLDWLPAHHSLSLEHNGHRTVYQTVEQYYCGVDWIDDWVSDAEMQKAIETDEVWVLHWYPRTPVEFHWLLASSLEALEAHFRKEKLDDHEDQ